jgi:hypothetical protein
MSRLRIEAVLLAISGLLFIAFPVIRPFGDGSGDSKVIAETFASSSWVIAHVAGLLAFILLALGQHGLTVFARNDQLAYAGFLVAAVGAGLTVAFFGAEAFGLHSIGEQALREGRTDALELANELRFGPAIFVMSAGLLAVVVGTSILAFAVSDSTLPRWSIVALPLGIFLWAVILGAAAQNQLIRIAESVLLAAGLWTLAWSFVRRPIASTSPNSR